MKFIKNIFTFAVLYLSLSYQLTAMIRDKDEINSLGIRQQLMISETATFQSAFDYAEAHNYRGGFPTFHEADYGNGKVYGVLFLKREAAEWRDIPVQELNNPTPTDIPERFRSVTTYAQAHNYRGGFPTFHEADYGNGKVYGTILVRGGIFEDIPEIVTHMLKDYTWDSQINRPQKLKVLQQYIRGYRSGIGCSRLSQQERGQLITQGYRKNISFGINNDPNVNASAIVNGNQIWINFAVLFPQGDNEIAQTLIHETMHCAGYNHPNRTANDRPGDNGPYYGTPPLRSEICIAGQQSLTSSSKNKECSPDGDKYTIKHKIQSNL